MRLIAGVKWLLDVAFEAFGVYEAADCVVGQIPESQSDSPEALQTPIDCFGGAVRDAGAVEVGQDVGGSFDQGLGPCLVLLQTVQDGAAQGFDGPLPQASAQAMVVGPVRPDQMLVAGKHAGRPRQLCCARR